MMRQRRCSPGWHLRRMVPRTSVESAVLATQDRLCRPVLELLAQDYSGELPASAIRPICDLVRRHWPIGIYTHSCVLGCVRRVAGQLGMGTPFPRLRRIQPRCVYGEVFDDAPAHLAFQPDRGSLVWGINSSAGFSVESGSENAGFGEEIGRLHAGAGRLRDGIVRFGIVVGGGRSRCCPVAPRIMPKRMWTVAWKVTTARRRCVSSGGSLLSALRPNSPRWG